MYRFGKDVPRSMNSYGIAGLLNDGCHIFYDALFSTRHFGRVTDLLSARLQKAGLDELQLRGLLMFSMFESYRAQISLKAWETESTTELQNPLTLECGIDEEKLAVGISFHLSDAVPLDVKGLKDRIISGERAEGFEKILGDLYDQADRMVFKHQPSTGRYEVVTLMGLTGQVQDAKVEGEDRFEYVELTEAVDETPPAKTYTQLGDTDYPTLLRDKKKLQRAKKTTLGELLAKGAKDVEDRSRKVDGDEDEEEDEVNVKKDKEAVEATKVKGLKETTSDDAERVGGDKTANDGSETIDGGDEEDDDESTRVTGAREAGSNREETRVKDGDKDKNSDKNVSDAQAGDASKNIQIRGGEQAAKLRALQEEGKAAEKSKLDKDGVVVVKGGNGKNTGPAKKDDQTVKGGRDLDLGDDDEEIEVSSQPEFQKKLEEAKDNRDVDQIVSMYKQQIGELQAKIQRLREELSEKDEAVLGHADGAKDYGRGGGEAQGGKKTKSGGRRGLAALFGSGGSEEDFEDEDDEDLEADERAVAKAQEEVGEEGVEEEEEAGEESGIKKVLKRMWPFGKKKKPARRADDGDEEDEEDEDDSSLEEKMAFQGDEGEEDKDKVLEDGEDADYMARRLMLHAESGSMSKTIKKAKAIRDEIKSKKGKAWLDSLVSDLSVERARIRHLSKKMSAAVRQKEIEFRNRERALEEQMKRKDEILRQKDNALNRAKEQQAQLNTNLERMRSISQGASLDLQYKKRFTYTQGLLKSAKEENLGLKRKVDMLRSAANSATRNKGPSQAEHNKVRSELDRASRRLKEQERQNQNLARMLKEQEKKQTASSVQSKDMNNKLEQSNRLANERAREIERLKQQIGTMSREGARLEQQLNQPAAPTPTTVRQGEAKPGAANPPAKKKPAA